MSRAIEVTVTGDFKNLERFLHRDIMKEVTAVLKEQARIGQKALASATPVDSGATAMSWGNEVKVTRDGATITWTNSNVHDGVPIAVILQYGHGTGTGGYVAGRDYINPAIRPMMEAISKKVEEVMKR